MSRTFYQFSFLYQTKKNEHEIYTDNPSGSFDLQRLIAGKPAWKQIRYANHLVKKRLVIYDWTFFNYTEIQAEDFYQLIDDLMTEQFEIYFWTSKSIELITSKNWYVYRGDPNKKILKWSQDYAHLAEVKKCIVNDCSWTEDEFFILDDYWLQVLQNTSYELPQRQLFISNLAPHPQAEKILLGASSLIPKVERVVADEISSNAINFFSKMERFIKSLNLKIAIHYQKLKLDTSDLNNLLNNDILPIADRIITKLDLADIEAIDFNKMDNAYLDTNELNKLFALTPHLKRINNLTYAENGVLLNPVPDLESLNISCGELPYKLWGDALKMRYLKSIFGFGSEVISDLKNINSLIAMEDYDLSLPDLSHLNKLKALEYLCEYPANLPKDLVRLELSYVDFNVIKSLRNLKELMVLENVPLPRQHDQIPSLEILRLTLLKLSEVAEVDRVFPNLKILEMGQIISDSDVKNLNITLNNIESLIISDKSLSKDIVCLIQNAPKLKKLSCHSLNYSPEEFANRSVYLPQLQHFTYSGDKDLFYSILENAPKLKFVKLEHFNKGLNNVFSPPSKTIWTTKFFIKDKLSNDLLYELLDIIKAKHLSITLEYQCNFLLENLPLASELQSLEIIGWVSNKLLNRLLYQTPRLKKLKISHTQSSDSIKLASNLFLPNLEEVILYKTPFSLENLDFLAKVAPNIKTLSISTLPLGVMVLHSSLNKLEQLTIEGAYLTVQNIQTLLIMCPNLVKLSLIGLQLADARIIDNVYESMVSNLNLTGSSINNTQLIQLLSLFPKLNNLSLIHCKKVVLNSISPFLKKIPIVDLKGIHSLPFRPQKKEDVQWCDFNTALPKEKLSAKRYFYSLSPGIDDPEIKFYRLKVFHELKIHANGTDPNHLVELIKSNDPQWRMLDNLKQHRIEGFINYAKQQAEMDREHYHYYGQVNFELTSAWQKLPSISPLEKLTDLAFAVEIPFEVRYSDRDNLYYLRALEGTATSHIHYIVRVPRVYPKLTMAQKFQQDINYLLQFQASGFNNIPQNLTGEGYLNLLWMLQVGACRHRSMLFLWRHAQDVRVIYNDCHAFIEVKVQGRWLKVDLGGYPAALEIIEEFISPAVSQNLNQAPQPQLVADTHMAKYASRLEPWRTQSKNWSSWEELRDDVLHQGQKILFEVNSPAEVNAVWANLSHYCHQANRHYFFIDNPDDLHCTLPYLAARSNSYQIQPGPGGLLFDFFQTCTNTALPALLIINYERFGVEDLIRTNSILDPERQIEGVLLPPSLSIVGIRNRMRSDVYEGADFISRWQRRVHIPANLTVTTVHLKTTNQSASCTLDLWDDAEAYELLLGRWRMMGAGFIYEEGLLVSAVAAGHRVIALRQAPLEVRTLCHQISTLGWIAHHGKRLEFPQGLQFQWTWGYDWQRLRNAITWLTAPKPRAYVLNPGHLPTFFSRYIDDPMKQNIQATSGWVKDAAGQLLPVTLSRSLTEGQWAQLLHYCLLHEVKLEVFCPQSVSVPEVLGLRPESQEPELIPNLRVIVSTERDSTVLNLLEQHPQARFADITECTSSDLWQHWHTRLDTEEYRFRIWHQPGWLQQALMGGETVILTGTFSADLQDALQTVWCGPNQAAWSGQLFLVTEHDNDFPLFAHQQHLVVVEEKKVRLLTRFSATLCAHLTAEQWSQESLSQLQARLRFLQRVPQGDSHDAWHGLQSLKPKWDDDAQADTVLAQRKAALEAVWATSPCVYRRLNGRR